MPGKIHFINRIDHTNAGDWSCCPLNYYFDFFKQYNLMRHDIDFIDWNEVNRHDVVILGGGGMIDVTRSFNVAINRLLERCDTVIAWSIGHNTHNRQWYQGNEFEKIDFRKFKLISIRDYHHPSGLEWLPCPSALAPEMRAHGATKRKIGIVEHRSIPIAGLPYDKISNACTLLEIADFIAGSETVVTNSYHVTYWAQLMGRKAVVFNKFSTKFDYFKYKPEFVAPGEGKPLVPLLEEAAAAARTYDGSLPEAIALNGGFFERVKAVITALDFPRGNDYQQIYQLTNPKSWNEQNERHHVRELMDFRATVQSRFESLERRLAEMDAFLERETNALHAHVAALHDDVHGRVDREAAVLHERISERERELVRLVAETREIANARVEALHADVHGRMDREAASLHERITAHEEKTRSPLRRLLAAPRLVGKLLGGRQRPLRKGQ